MGNLVFQATLGGQVNLVGPNTASTFNLNVPAVAGTLVTTGDTGTVTNTMLAGSIANAKLTNSSVTVGSTSIALGATSTTVAGLTLTTPTISSGGANFNGSTSGTINLVATATAGSNTATLPAATGTVMVSGNMPAFSAYQNNPSQSISASTYTKIQLNTEDFDTANAFDSSTNYRFTPQVAGYYQISGQIFYSSSILARTTVFIYKNGSQYRSGSAVPQNGSNNVGNSISCLVYLNGSTDYIELYAYVGAATTLGYQAVVTDSCYMTGVLVRGA
jgi:hypothetical protein